MACLPAKDSPCGAHTSTGALSPVCSREPHNPGGYHTWTWPCRGKWAALSLMLSWFTSPISFYWCFFSLLLPLLILPPSIIMMLQDERCFHLRKGICPYFSTNVYVCICQKSTRLLERRYFLFNQVSVKLWVIYKQVDWLLYSPF